MFKKMVILVLLLIIFIILKTKEMFKSPCSDNITDKEYLQHMIPHHQVAVDISLILQKKTRWPKMQEILRKLIWTQRYEISLMKQLLKQSIQKITSYNKVKKLYMPVKSDFIKPNKVGLTKTYCDPHFFDPEKHMEHIKKMNIDNKMYIHHMIPHHQVAVDMSKKLLKNTKNDFMINFAYRIIKTQQEEIVLLNDLMSDKNYKFESNKIL